MNKDYIHLKDVSNANKGKEEKDEIKDGSQKLILYLLKPFYMKQLILLIFGLHFFLAQNLFAQLPNYNWTKVIESTSDAIAYDIAIDDSNNLYVLSNYSGTIDLDIGSGTNLTTSVGSSDLCIIKMDVFGNYIWGKSFGGYGNDFGVQIVTDSSGAIYVAGNFNDSISFNTQSSVDHYISNGSSDIFILKLNNQGDILWSRAFGALYADVIGGITVDDIGNICVVGDFNGTIDFDPGVAIENRTTNGALDIFALSLNSQGDYLWANTFGSQSSDRAISVTRDNSGNLLIGGLYNDSIDFDPGINTMYKTTNGSWDAYVLKLSSNGDLIWVRTFGGTSGERVESITCDPWGNVISTGRFLSVVDFDTGPTVENHGVSPLITDNIFVHKLDSDGNFIWAKTLISSYSHNSLSICSDDLGNIYTTGKFTNSMDFNPNTEVDIHAASASFGNTSDVFLQKLNSDGSYAWTKTLGDVNHDIGYDVETIGSSLIYLIGEFQGSVNFNPDGAPDFHYSSQNGSFIQKLNQCMETYSTINIDVCEGYSSPSGNHYWATSGIFYDTLLNSALCDSIITINLNVNYSSNWIDQQVACDSFTWTDGNTYYSSNNTATRTMTTTFGCDSIITLNLTINNVSDLSTTAVGLTLVANNVNATYQWLDCGNNYSIIPSETNQSFIATDNGDYAVELSENGCVDTSSCIVVSSVSIIENSFGNKLTIFPNPSNGDFSINFGKELQTVRITIEDLNGKVVQTETYNNSQLLNVKLEAAAGMYFLNIESANNKAVIRLLKK